MTHHAYLYCSQSRDLALLPNAVQTASTDVAHFVQEAFGIADARTLQKAAFSTAVGEGGRSFVVSFTTITTEAQNALLKLLEEPPSAVTFYVLVTGEQVLLPTVRSRLQLVDVTKEESVGDETYAAFCAASLKERIEEIAAKTKAKDTAWQQAIYQGVVSEAGKEKTLVQKQALTLYINNFNRRGAAKKMLLEHLALSL